VKVFLIPGSVKSFFSSYICHEELKKGRDPMLQCWEGSEVAVLSEGVDDTWYCEELLVFKEVS
jgi:hypothetical protein